MHVNACAISRDARWFVAGHDVSVTAWHVTTQEKIAEHNPLAGFPTFKRQKVL